MAVIHFVHAMLPTMLVPSGKVYLKTGLCKLMLQSACMIQQLAAPTVLHLFASLGPTRNAVGRHNLWPETSALVFQSTICGWNSGPQKHPRLKSSSRGERATARYHQISSPHTWIQYTPQQFISILSHPFMSNFGIGISAHCSYHTDCATTEATAWC